jgi:hypothetical protein
MSDTTIIRPTSGPKTPARPVSLFTVVFLFVVFGAFAFLVHRFYTPSVAVPQIQAPENLSKDLAWKATRDSRRATLAEVHEQQTKDLATYGWLDQKTGAVRLPIERAMELTAEKYGKKQ